MSFRIPAQPETPPPPPPPAPDHSAALAELELWRASFPFHTPRAVMERIGTLNEKVSELEALVVVRGEQLAKWEAMFEGKTPSEVQSGLKSMIEKVKDLRESAPKPKKAKAKKAKK